MQTQIALLRAINVGGNRLVGMTELRQLLAGLGMLEVRSLLQSGNVVFRSPNPSNLEGERLLESAIEKRFEFPVEFFLRTTEEWKTILAVNPFVQEAKSDPGHLLIMFLKDAPDRKRVEALQAAIPGQETVAVVGRHAYLYYPDGSGRSKLTNLFIEKHLGFRGTARNWNTMQKLHVLAREIEAL